MSSDSSQDCYAPPSDSSDKDMRQDVGLTIKAPVVNFENWQEGLLSVRDRDVFLLRHGRLSDCTFRVGPDKKEFLCHRVYLAKTSAVFEAMLYKELYKEGEVIEIPDVSPQAFEAMLKYMYEGEIRLKDYGDVCELLYLAKKYQLPASLTEACRAFLWANLYPPENVWQAIEFASSNDEQTLLETAWQVVQMFTTEALKSASFLEISQSTLLRLLSTDNLSCKEPDLYKASLSWARSEAEHRGLSGDPQAIREVLEEALKHIRFLSMSASQVSEGPVKDEVLKVDEACPILAKLNDPEKETTLPETLCQVSKARKFEEPKSFRVHGCPPEYWKVVEDWERYNPRKNTNLFDIFRADKDYKQYKHEMYKGHVGIRIPSQIQPPGCLSETYEENLTVLVHNAKYYTCPKNLISETHFKGTVKYNSYIDVKYTKGFYLKCYQTDFDHKITVICHTSGEYPMKQNIYRSCKESSRPSEEGRILDGKFEGYRCKEYKDSKFVISFVCG